MQLVARVHGGVLRKAGARWPGKPMLYGLNRRRKYRENWPGRLQYLTAATNYKKPGPRALTRRILIRWRGRWQPANASQWLFATVALCDNRVSH